jgi:cellulose synthase/poly-beta-1,6-N-acetylglucosamine synthase-like glycosyltransferase
MAVMAISAFFLSLYVILAFMLSIRLSRAPKEILWEPSISIIVAARNEEKHLPACLEALARLEYPADKLQIVLVNDASTDGSAQIMQTFCSTRPHFHLVELLAGEKRKPGKAGALLAGIERSSGEIICVTDADCLPPPTWIRGLLSMFQLRVGMVGGFTVMEPAQTVIQEIQALDWIFLLSAASAVSLFNRPISWVGNNLAFRRQVYEQVGGYTRLGDSLVEDFALINAIRRETTWRCLFYPSPASTVCSTPAATLRELYRQRRRWTTGVGVAPPAGLALMAIAAATHLSLLAGLLFSPWAFLGIIFKAAVDWVMIRCTSRILQVQTPGGRFILFEIYFMLYTIIMPVLMLFDRKIVWKDAQFDAGLKKS